MNAGRVLFVGCGPGAADLLTLRAIEAIERADIVIWSPSLIDRQILVERMRPGAEIVAWPPARQPEILATYDRAVAEGLLVVRLKGGDPGLLGGLEPELSAARERGLGCERSRMWRSACSRWSSWGCRHPPVDDRRQASRKGTRCTAHFGVGSRRSSQKA